MTSPTILDKSTWSDGPWKTEPDEIKWGDKDTGYKFAIVRGPHGALNGYVGIPKDHSLYGVDYDDVELSGFDVHGGLTYSGDGFGADYDGYWWFGFDTAHAGDYCPKPPSYIAEYETYKPVEYVWLQVINLAKQLEEYPL